MDNATNKRLAILAYVVPILGPLYLLAAKRDHIYIQYHARQMLALTLAVAILPLAWAIGAWLLSWIPIAGPAFAATLFALVILGGLFAIGIWIAGLVQVIYGQLKPLPIVWNLSRRWFATPRVD